MTRAQTWLLHTTRSNKHSGYNHLKEGEHSSEYNPLDSINVTYRPRGGSEWLDISSKNDDNETSPNVKDEKLEKDKSHLHGTKYKREMYR